MDLRFFVMRSPCHVGGGRGAVMHSTTRVNGFLGMQSQDIYTAAQKHCGMNGGGRYPHILRRCGVQKPSKRVWSAHTQKNMDKIEFLYVSCAATEIC